MSFELGVGNLGFFEECHDQLFLEIMDMPTSSSKWLSLCRQGLSLLLGPHILMKRTCISPCMKRGWISLRTWLLMRGSMLRPHTMISWTCYSEETLDVVDPKRETTSNNTSWLYLGRQRCRIFLLKVYQQVKYSPFHQLYHRMFLCGQGL